MARPLHSAGSVSSPETTPGGRLSDRAYHHVKLLILDGGLDAGDPIAIERLAHELGVSRQPVMDAMKRLEAEGLVEIVPQVGCRVIVPSASEVGDFYRLFAAMEAELAALAAARRTPEELELLHDVLAEVEIRLSKAGPPEANDPAYRRIGRLLHEALHRMAKAPQAVRISEALWDQSDFYLRSAFGSLYFPEDVRETQRAIIEAVRSGDVEAARQATTALLLAAGERASRRLRDHPRGP